MLKNKLTKPNKELTLAEAAPPLIKLKFNSSALPPPRHSRVRQREIDYRLAIPTR